MAYKPKQLYILGIDWGKQTVGLAIGDVEVRIATALESVSAQNSLERVGALKKEFEFKDVVLGKPDVGKKFDAATVDMINVFAQGLKAQGLTVHFEQEAFSSLMAQENLKQFKKKGIMQDNAEAARIILQSWLDKSLG